MVTDQIDERQQVHTLIDLLPAEKLHAVRGLLEVLVDPVSQALANAPPDDEELSQEGIASLKEAADWSKKNKPIPHEQVLADLVITAEEIRCYREPV